MFTHALANICSGPLLRCNQKLAGREGVVAGRREGLLDSEGVERAGGKGVDETTKGPG